jgi:hypothetical protein
VQPNPAGSIRRNSVLSLQKNAISFISLWTNIRRLRHTGVRFVGILGLEIVRRVHGVDSGIASRTTMNVSWDTLPRTKKKGTTKLRRQNESSRGVLIRMSGMNGRPFIAMRWLIT